MTKIDTDEKHNLLPKLAAGGLSCMFPSAIVNPMDVVKVRLQTQSQGLKGIDKSKLEYRGFNHTVKKIYLEEGYWKGLQKGLTASMLRELSYSSMRLGLYDVCKRIYAPNVVNKEDFTLVQKILAGGTSGMIGSAIANPTDLIKIKFQYYTPKNPNPYKNTFHAFYKIYKEKGLYNGLYKGSTPTIVRAALLTSSQLASYDHSKRYLLTTDYFQDNFKTHLVSSLISGLVTTIVCNPADCIKTRWMTDRAKYQGPIDCFIKTLKHEGPRALMKGFLPNYYRLGSHFVVSLPLLEYFRGLFGVDSI